MSFSNEAAELARGANVRIGEGTRIAGGKIVLGDGVQIGQGVDIEVTERFVVGKDSLIRDGTIIHGRRIELGREFYTNHHAEIGGGSCFEKTSSLKIGYWFHLGSFAMVNTAMPVTIGNEVGLGRFSNLYTHGAYLSLAEGFPVQLGPITIGNRVWLPSATVNPGVTIGDDVVVGVGSVVTRDIPPHSLAVGTPAKVVREHYPARPPEQEVRNRVREIFQQWGVPAQFEPTGVRFQVAGAAFDVNARRIEGMVTPDSERTRNILRRLGIRFRYEAVDGTYAPWREDPPGDVK